MPDPTTAPLAEHDGRLTWGLILDVFEALERHGYVRADNRAVGAACATLLQLSREYEGRDR